MTAARAEAILDAALEMAEERGWEGVRLRRVAEALGLALPEVAAEFRDLDAVADAWFARGRHAMLAPPPEGFYDWPPEERVHLVMMRWFEALSPHRHVTGEMLRAKLYPSHPHHWVPMVFSLSRLIQWVREAAALDATGRRRQAEEVALTWIFLRTLRTWLGDETPGQQRTRNALRRRLRRWALTARRRGPATAPAAGPRRSAAARRPGAAGG